MRTRQRARALADLDHAPIGTLHAFARRILNDFPIDAGLPPGFGVLDELDSNLRFDDEWSDLLDHLLGDPDPASPLDGGRQLVELCNFENFGVDKYLQQGRARLPVQLGPHRAAGRLLRPRTVRVARRRRHRIAHARWLPMAPLRATPTGQLVTDVGAVADQLAGAPHSSAQLDLLVELAKVIGKPMRKGSKANWKRSATDALNELREREQSLVDDIETVLQRVRAYRKRLAGAIAGRFVLDAVRGRIEAGVLDFHDLLVHARRLLAEDDNVEIRRALHERYQRVLLDEFQDTDPIQLEIAVRLTVAARRSPPARRLAPARTAARTTVHRG